MHVKKVLTLVTLGMAVVLLGASLLSAQDPVIGSKDPESLFISKDPKLNTNKQAAMHIMRDLLEAGHWDEAPKWLTEKVHSAQSLLRERPADCDGFLRPQWNPEADSG
jgi:hypothetical protein